MTLENSVDYYVFGTQQQSAILSDKTKPKKAILRKRKRVGKTPAEKINWTPEEVS